MLVVVKHMYVSEKEAGVVGEIKEELVMHLWCNRNKKAL